ncbi:MAG: phosphoglucosamine mutase [Clostridia bacterium]|nr:phosphoglucosamine mutase [Clostridia bacterium]
MARLFGTDGARGIANADLNCELAMNIGRAAALVLTEGKENIRPRILIGYDTRISSKMLEAAMSAGICSVGADVLQVGVVPTPAVAYLVKAYGADAGVMISASHNPCEYNGIKLFSNTGYKLSDELEDKIEAIVKAGVPAETLPTGGDIGHITLQQGAVEDYIKHIISSVPESVRFDGMKVALDCANGSSSVTAEAIFTRLGATVHVMNDTPDGVNINDRCGSTYMDGLMNYVKENNMDLGLAFDGDADRCLAVDAEGTLVDGDQLIAINALDMKEKGELKEDTAVVTVMTNMGFWKFAEKNELTVRKTAVGDRYVLEDMLAGGYSIGGEQSGHIIFKDHATTGDGQLTGVQLMSVMRRKGKTLKRLAEVMKIYPQTLKNIMVTPQAKEAFGTDSGVQNKIKEIEQRLGDTGRVLVRLSGTEPKIRVMLEGEDQQQIEAYADEIINTIKERLL